MVAGSPSVVLTPSVCAYLVQPTSSRPSARLISAPARQPRGVDRRLTGVPKEDAMTIQSRGQRLIRPLVLGLALSIAPVATAASTSPASATVCESSWGSLTKQRAPHTSKQITDVRSGRHTCFDRLVISLNGDGRGNPGYYVKYVRHVTKDGSGQRVPLRGRADIAIVINAPAHDPTAIRRTSRRTCASWSTSTATRRSARSPGPATSRGRRSSGSGSGPGCRCACSYCAGRTTATGWSWTSRTAGGGSRLGFEARFARTSTSGEHLNQRRARQPAASTSTSGEHVNQRRAPQPAARRPKAVDAACDNAYQAERCVARSPV